MRTRKTTKKAATKRKTKESYTVADLRVLLQQAAGALIAIDDWLSRKVEGVGRDTR